MSLLHHVDEPLPRATAPASPWPPGAVYATAAAIAAALGIAAGLGVFAPAVVACVLLAVGAERCGERLFEGHRRRVEADSWILQAGGAFGSRRAWRVAELTSARERRLLARSLRSIVDELRQKRAAVGGVVNRPALRPHADLISELADRLAALERPVTAFGILRVRWLLCDPGSPIYAATWARENTAHEIDATLRSLEPS
jgi:hypothetical protein